MVSMEGGGEAGVGGALSMHRRELCRHQIKKKSQQTSQNTQLYHNGELDSSMASTSCFFKPLWGVLYIFGSGSVGNLVYWLALLLAARSGPSDTLKQQICHHFCTTAPPPR